MKRLLPIVEGHGEDKAVPLLLRRILESQGIYSFQILPARRYGEYPSVIKNFDHLFLAAIKEKAPILWVMDFDAKDYDCPVREALRLYARADTLRPGWPLKIVFLVKEYETLFLHDETATRTVFPDIPRHTVFPSQPELIRGAKEWLSEKRPKGMAYKETIHQAKITAHLNIDQLRQKSGDFAHLERAVLNLFHSPIPD